MPIPPPRRSGEDRLRIAIDLTGLQAGGGGIVTYAAGLLRGWREVAPHDELTLFAGPGLPDRVRREAAPGSRWVEVPDQRPDLRVVMQQVALPFVAARARADAILAITPVLPLASNLPLVGVVHDLRYRSAPQEFSALKRTYRTLLYHVGYHRAERLAVVSDATLRDLRAACPAGGAKAEVIRLGSDHVDGWGAGQPRGTHGLVFAHWANKRPDVAIRAWASLKARHQGFARPLHVIGASQEARESLGRLSVDLGLADLVEVHGYLPELEFRSLFATAAVVLMPSTIEGFGLPVVEAMRLRVPVVASRDRALVEVGGDAILYGDPAVPESFARSCERLLFGNEGKQLVDLAARRSERLRWAITAEGTRRLTGEAIATRGRGRGRD